MLSSKLLIHASFQVPDSRNFTVLCPSSVAGLQKSRKPLGCSATHTLLCGNSCLFPCHFLASYSFNPAMAAAGNVLFRFCFSPMVVTQVIEQINHHMRKGSESQVKCMGLRSVTVWLWFATEILMHFNSASNGFPECPLPSINCSLPSIPPAKWK